LTPSILKPLDSSLIIISIDLKFIFHLSESF
jgi:hypothetical protein